VTVERVCAETGWKLRIADDVRETRTPTVEELAALRDLNDRTADAFAGTPIEERTRTTSLERTDRADVR
jgi:glutaconate CoA-transferase subunit B